MDENATLELDIDEALAEPGNAAPARVKVASLWGYTRHDGAPVVSRNCTSFADFRREAERLKEELDATMADAQKHFGQSGEPVPTQPQAVPKASPVQAEIRLAADATVRDLMTSEVRTVSPNDRLRLVDELMQSGGFRHVVVVSEDEDVVGVVSQHDIMFAGIAWALGVGRTAHQKALESVAVKEIMSSHVVAVDPDEKLSVAATLLFQRKIGCLPVMEGPKLVGILTEADFLAQLAMS